MNPNNLRTPRTTAGRIPTKATSGPAYVRRRPKAWRVVLWVAVMVAGTAVLMGATR